MRESEVECPLVFFYVPGMHGGCPTLGRFGDRCIWEAEKMQGGYVELDRWSLVGLRIFGLGLQLRECILLTATWYLVCARWCQRYAVAYKMWFGFAVSQALAERGGQQL